MAGIKQKKDIIRLIYYFLFSKMFFPPHHFKKKIEPFVVRLRQLWLVCIFFLKKKKSNLSCKTKCKGTASVCMMENDLDMDK